jgi:hypothetical protein
MTTADVETYANLGNVAVGMNLQYILRYQIIPEFLEDVKYASWRKKYGTVTTVAGTRSYDLATDFHQMHRLRLSGADEDLPYIGEDSTKVFAAEVATTQAEPTGWYLGRNPNSQDPPFAYLSFDAPPDDAYVYQYQYYSRVVWTDQFTPVGLSQHIPEQYQWGLVEGLRREVYLNRVGVNDQRYIVAAQQFEVWKQRAISNTELAPAGQRPIFAR